MTRGLYGRMQRGRCITSSSALGCKTNVLPTLDDLCSNKQECNVDVAKGFVNVENACHSDFMRYLEADFKCVKGMCFNFRSTTILVILFVVVHLTSYNIRSYILCAFEL